MVSGIRSSRIFQLFSLLVLVTVLAGCSSVPLSASRTTEQQAVPARAQPKDVPVLPAAGSGRGGYYLDDGPGDHIPEGLHDVPDAEPKVEPYARGPNRPYDAFGKTYVPITDNRPYKERGFGSWYGKKFHGKRTSSGEPYDMYKMTAAHPTLPIPSYARVTNLGNGRQVIVRVNDRGPFKSGRIIDLSYTAALRLGYLGKGSGQLEVEHLLPDEIERLAQRKKEGAAIAQNNEGGQPYGDFLEKFLTEGSGDAKPVVASISGYYLQLGVFRQADNARSMQAKYARDWRSDVSQFELVNSGEFVKLMAGPFATREMAAKAAKRFRESEGLNPLIVQR